MPEAIKIDWERKIPQEVRDYWDANLENNPLRLATKETDAGAFLAKKIESAGDVLRELAKAPSDMSYINEKLNAIRRELGSTDWTDRLARKESAALKETQTLIVGIPAPDQRSQAVKDLVDAVASRSVSRIRMALDRVDRVLSIASSTPEADNPSRVRFDRASIDSAIAAAKRLESEKDLYIFATHLGYTIDSRPPPGMQQYVVVYPDGSTETVKPQIGGNPMKEIITKEEAIGMLERLSMTPEEAARFLVADEAERREIVRTVQERVKREQNKWAPMDPREGPPLPRIFAGLRWPWKK